MEEIPEDIVKAAIRQHMAKARAHIKSTKHARTSGAKAQETGAAGAAKRWAGHVPAKKKKKELD